MNIDWQDFLRRLRSAYTPGTHRILPPCPLDRIEAVQAEFGALPEDLARMLRHFNGAELFIKTMPLISVFGISTVPSLSPEEWAPEWYIEKFTPKWRSGGHRNDQWPIAMKNYGVLILIDSRGMTKEWATGQRSWEGKELGLNDRFMELLREGEIYVSES
jgi:hypothetical protein